MINESLARFSNYALYGAMLVYALAFFGYAAEWVFGSKSRFVVAASAEAPAESALVGAAVGGDATAGDAVGSAGDVKDPFPTDAFGRPAMILPGVDDPDPAIHNGNLRAATWGGAAVSLTTLGFLLHVASVALRGFAAHRVPWGNLFEFSVAGSCVAMAIYMLLLWKKDARWLGVFVTGTVLLVLGLALVVLYHDADQLVPALHSYWLVVHVMAAVICSGAFTVATLATILYLFKSRYETKAKLGTANPNSMWRRVPAAMKLDLTAYRILAFSFPIWTFTVIAGSIWAERAWGRYWGWDPTETWAFITWVVYAAYLHARATMGWKGRNAAIIAIVGYGAFIFNYFFVSIFVNGLHSYAGVK
jgi:cytochrome c-type biogenesis protein CcsB